MNEHYLIDLQGKRSCGVIFSIITFDFVFSLSILFYGERRLHSVAKIRLYLTAFLCKIFVIIIMVMINIMTVMIIMIVIMVMIMILIVMILIMRIIVKIIKIVIIIVM